MTSISVSDYRPACADLVRDAIRVPRMYYNTLHELEVMLSGHRFAFQQLGAIENKQSFNFAFAHWLYETKGASAASGWAYAIEDLIAEEGEDRDRIFAELAEEFLREWSNSSTD